MLIDTDILIWALKENEAAVEYIDSLAEVYISDVTYMELVQGSRSKQEFRDIQKTLDHITAEKIPITESISQKAVELVEMYAHSHSMQLGDALIAATAIVHQMSFSSGNRKHFEYIPELDFTAFRKD